MIQEVRIPEAAQIMNDVYATVFPVLAKYETKGFNAHTRAQKIALETCVAVEEWVSVQETAKSLEVNGSIQIKDKK